MKKTFIFLCAACVISLSILVGLMVYSAKKDYDNTKKKEDTKISTGSEDSKDSHGDTSIDTTSPSVSNVPTQADTNKNPSDSSVTVPDKQVSADPNTGKDPLDPSATPTVSPDKPIVLAFAGDINLDEASKPVDRYDREGKGILGCISEGLLNEMNSADIMMLNNEFAYSTRGKKAPNKSYTFRADPSRVNILKEMGVDIVSLANNHALDYGMDALLDTFDTLDNADIDYVGAGNDLDRALEPIYYTIGNKKIAILAASRVVFATDWYATDTTPGMIGTYDPSLIIESIKEAKANSDYVVIYVHWGVERTNYPEDYQRIFAKKYIDAGADIVIGSHPHVLQGLEFYKGKPIAYSLGNYWFNNSSRETGLLKVIINTDGSLSTQLIPAMGENTFTSLIKNKSKRENYFDFMEKISFGISIDKNGYVTPKK